VKKSKLTKLIQKPLRFHHQDLHEEIEGLTQLIVAINNRLISIESKLSQDPQPASPSQIQGLGE
jgi:hypothetical protein